MEEKRLVRVQRSEREWREIVERQARSGMGVRPFCDGEGISAGCFYHWRARISRARSGRFVEVTPELMNRSRIRAELDLGQGVVVRIF